MPVQFEHATPQPSLFRTSRRRGAFWAVLLSACGTATDDPVTQGHHLFSSRDISASSANLYTCQTCHDTSTTANGLIKTGAPLAGATLRPSFWGGQENDLLSAVNQCLTQFMRSPAPLEPNHDHAIALYAYLQSLEPGDPNPFTFETVRLIDDPLERGDATRGAAEYVRACAYCHGAPHTALGSLASEVTLLPEEVLAEHEGFAPRDLRLVLIEKVRHGRFYGYGGVMPPFSRQVLSDEQLADILELLGLTGI